MVVPEFGIGRVGDDAGSGSPVPSASRAEPGWNTRPTSDGRRGGRVRRGLGPRRRRHDARTGRCARIGSRARGVASSGTGSTMARRTRVDVGAHCKAEEDHLGQRKQEQDRQRLPIAEQVPHLLAHEGDERAASCERRARSCGRRRGATPRASRTKISSRLSVVELGLQRVRRSQGGDPAIDHDRDPVAVLRLVEVVRRDEDRGAFGARPRRSTPRTGGG